jgi:tetratricopeptide (TPR) repeat protein
MAAVKPDASQLPATLHRAVVLHRKGDLARAQALYEEILTVRPRHFDALHLLGVVAMQSDNPQLAVELIAKAIEIHPNSAASHCNRGSALEALGQWHAALLSYDQAIAIQANHAVAHYNRGNVLHKLKRCEAALASYDRAIAIKPGLAEAHFNRGNALLELRQLAAACSSYDSAIALRPNYAEAYFNRGRVLKELKQRDAALSSYAKAIAIRADYAEAYSNLGNVQQELGRWDEALANYAHALKIKADFPEAHFNQGVLLHQLGRFEDALYSYDRAIAYRSDYSEAYSNRGNVLAELNQLAAAMGSYQKAIELERKYAEAHFNLSIALLLAGEFEQGWNEYEWRWENTRGSVINERRDFPQPLWLGAEIPIGKTILLYGEQGLGDTIQFCRYAKLVASLGATVILEVQEALVRLLAGLEGMSLVVARGSALPAFDLQCPLMSLPLAFKTALENIPSAIQYLLGDPDNIARWQARLGERNRPQVGLVWSGNARQRNDHKRSIPLASLIKNLPSDCRYVCLQRDLREFDEQTLKANPDVLNFGQELDFENTAALCECLDLVISVDTSVAHLSAALGKKTWILLPFNPDWRWLLERNDSPWYPTVTLYRQHRIGDWSGAFEKITADLSHLFQSWRAGTG